MEFLEVPFFDDDIYKLLVRFAINLFFLTLIVRFAIYPSQKEREFAFTAVMLNIIVFFICFTMKKLQLDLGLALGLFAIFGVLRYRTDALRPKEMTYLFIVIGVGVINSLSNKKTSYAEVAFVNFMIFSAAMLKEWIVGRVALSNGDSKSTAPEADKQNNGGKKSRKYSIEYDRLELLGDQNREALLADIKQRTGMEVGRIEVKTIDLLQNKATLTIFLSDTAPEEENPDQT